MKVLVMGGSMFNGLALVRELVRHGHDVTVCNRGKTPAPLPSRVARRTADRTDHDQLRAALGTDDWDCVFDISAYHPEDVEVMIEILAGRTGHYVFASSTVIYASSDRLPITEDFPVDRSEHQTEYGLHKLLCEDRLLRAWREAHFPATIAAFSMVFGPRNILPDREQRMFTRLAQGRPILIPGDGTTLGQIGHVDDEARALRSMMQKPQTFGRRYNLTGPDYFSDHGYVDTFAEVMGLDPASVRKVSIPAETMDELWDGRVNVDGAAIESNADVRASSALRDPATVQRWQLSMLVQRIAPNLHRWNRSTLFSIDRLRSDVGFEPEFDFRAAVEHTWEWFQAEKVQEERSFDFGFEDRLLARLGD